MIDPAAPRTGRVVLTLLSIVAVSIGGASAAQDATTTDTATATTLSSTWIAFAAPFTGDDNRNGWTVYELGLDPGGPFDLVSPRKITGPPEWRADNFRGLTADTDYYIRVTFVDPDGVSGPNPQIVGPVHTFASAPDAVTITGADLDVRATEILVSVDIQDDANASSYGTVEIATDPGGPWTRRCGNPSSNSLPFHPKRCRLRSLSASSDYWVRVTVVDPDGVSGVNPLILGPVTYTGVGNLAFGRPITADPGWGCCPNPAQLVDGMIQYEFWPYGFAWTGGTTGYGGGPPGWKQATIDFGAPTEFDQVNIWFHDANTPPTTWRIETSNDGASWSEVFSTTEAMCRGAVEQLEGTHWSYPGCSHEAAFSPVTTRYVRYNFDDRTLFGGLHGWAVELEVSNGSRFAELSIVKSDSQDPIVAGTALTYTVQVDNIGPSEATAVAVTETLPAEVTLVSTNGCAEDPSGVPTCSMGTIAAGEFGEYTILVDVDPGTLGAITNTAEVNSDAPDSDPSDNSTSEQTAVVADADLSIIKSDSQDPIVAGTALTYTLRVDNAGPSDAAQVVVTDTLPAGVTLVSTNGCAEDPSGVPTCSMGTIAAGEFGEYAILVDVDPGTLGMITNTADVASDTPDSDPSDNSASEETLVVVPTIFVDGFESGNTSAWSATVP